MTIRWDEVSKKAFDESYYGAEDADDQWKPGEDPLAGLGDLNQYNGGGEGGGTEEEEVKGGAPNEWHQNGGVGEDEEGEGEGAEDIKKKLLDELYKLDYEDLIGDIPCRFKYTSVKADDFGLTPEEVLLADDKDLNKFVSLKKLAPYRHDQPKVDAKRRRRLREQIRARQEEVEEEIEKVRSRKRRG
ncbi:unnamed protein product, partial [Choristocarpus tenellus]